MSQTMNLYNIEGYYFTISDEKAHDIKFLVADLD